MPYCEKERQKTKRLTEDRIPITRSGGMLLNNGADGFSQLHRCSRSVVKPREMTKTWGFAIFTRHFRYGISVITVNI
jgi:hypothetical protein